MSWQTANLGQPPSLDDMEEMAEQASWTIPEELRWHVDGVMIRIVEFPGRETEVEMGLQSPFDLLGLYRGVLLDQKSVAWTSTEMDIIFLYRRPILDYWCETGEPLMRIVRHVLIHEIGHHFGLSDAKMHRLEALAEAEKSA